MDWLVDLQYAQAIVVAVYLLSSHGHAKSRHCYVIRTKRYDSPMARPQPSSPANATAHPERSDLRTAVEHFHETITEGFTSGAAGNHGESTASA